MTYPRDPDAVLEDFERAHQAEQRARVQTPAEALVLNRAYEEHRRRYAVEHPLIRVAGDEDGTKTLL